MSSSNFETIKQNIDEWASKRLGSNFKFRPHQKEQIARIVQNVVNSNSVGTHVIEAPTGSGKSILLVVSAGVLNEYYEKTSYILCSDLYLFSQYEDLIKKVKLDFGMLKGQTGNYYCDKNGLDMRNAECRIANVPFSKLYDANTADSCGFGCARYCTYLKERRKAQRAKVTLMTYQLYLYMINVINNNWTSEKRPPFPPRDVIFCDECHNIPSIVQSQYSPTVSLSVASKLNELLLYNINVSTGMFAALQPLPWKTPQEFQKEFLKHWQILCDEHLDPQANYDEFFAYVSMVSNFRETVDYIEMALAAKKDAGKNLNKENYEHYKLASWYRNYQCMCNDFCTALSDCGAQYIIKNVSEPATPDAEKVVSFNCAKEDYMCWHYLLSTSSNCVLTSATVGGQSAFSNNIGVHYTKDAKALFDKIPSTFDFSRSPIYAFTKYKMSYNNKQWVFPKIQSMAYDIIREIPGRRGIIQTGSYANAKEIYYNAPADVKSRLILYNTSKEKDCCIDRYKQTKDGILVGPTLVEGIDFPGDLLRFIIITKVPYPSLSDKLVKAKMQLFPGWYDSETANTMIQGIGRGNRTPDDWSVTYVLDGCFENLFNKTQKQFPIELTRRIQVIR